MAEKFGIVPGTEQQKEELNPVDLLPYQPENNYGNYHGSTEVTLALDRCFWGAKIQAYSEAGKAESLNADSIKVARVDDRIYAGVTDGVTSKYQYRELAKDGLTGAAFASRLLRDEFAQNIGPEMDLKQHLVELNTLLREKTQDLHLVSDEGDHKPDFGKPSQLPSSTGTFVCIDPSGDKLEIAHVGDSFAFIEYEDGSTELLSLDTNLVHDTNTMRFIKAKQEADPDTKTFREAREKYASDIESYEAGSFDQKNNPSGPSKLGLDEGMYNYGTGILNGQYNFDHYIVCDRISLQGVKAVFLGSDGIVPIGMSENRDSDRRKILEIVRQGGVSALREERKRNAEDDKDFELDPRMKDMDDATGVFIEISSEGQRAE